MDMTMLNLGSFQRALERTKSTGYEERWPRSCKAGRARTCLSTPRRFVLKELEDERVSNFRLNLDELEESKSG